MRLSCIILPCRGAGKTSKQLQWPFAKSMLTPNGSASPHLHGEPPTENDRNNLTHVGKTTAQRVCSDVESPGRPGTAADCRPPANRTPQRQRTGRRAARRASERLAPPERAASRR